MTAPALMARTYLGRTNGLLREVGPLGLAARVLRKVGHSIVETGTVTFFVAKAGGDPAPGSSRFTVRQLYPSDREAVLAGSRSDWPSLRARFEKGDLCFGALDAEGLAVHTRWVTLDRAPVPELGLEFVPASDAAYFYDGYTRPDARRQGVDALVRNAIFTTVARLGRSRVFSYVRDDNPAGLRAAARVQAAVGSVRYLRFLRGSPRALGASHSAFDGQLRKISSRRGDGASEREGRASAWRGWFEGWLEEPMNRRSIGFHGLPQEAFEAMAAHIASTLQLDTSRDSVLDLGCDSALVTRHVAPRCARLTGVDFIPGMLIDAKRERETKEPTPGVSMSFSGADGRALPFTRHTFTKSYCTGVVHTLPSHEDAFRMIVELARVTKPGGKALVAAVPDLRKKWRARREAFRLGGFREKAQVVAALVLPRPVRRFARRVLPGLEESPLRYLEFDLHEVGRKLAQRGYRCEVLDYPADFWSRDFRETRSNLLITVP